MAAVPPPPLRQVRWATTVLVVGAIAAALALFAWALTHQAPLMSQPATRRPISQETVDPAAYAAQLRLLVDDQRTRAGLPHLTDAPCAAAEAERRADLLIGRPLQVAPLEAVRSACAGAAAVAENLGRAAAPPSVVVADWMSVAGHRAHILDAALTGTAVVCTHDGIQMLCSQLFVGGTG